MRALALVVLAACGDRSPPPAPVQQPHVLAGSAAAPACTRVVFGAYVVDAGSAVMERIRTYVSVEGGQSRSQGGAIRLETEEWTTGGGSGPFGPAVTTDVFASAADRAALERFFADLARVDPELAAPPDHTILVEPVGNRWRSYLVHATPAITSAHVARALVADDASGRRLILTLTDDGNRALYDVTGENVGRKLALVLDGTIWTAPIVESRIDGGGIAIAMPAALPRTELDALAARFTCSP